MRAAQSLLGLLLLAGCGPAPVPASRPPPEPTPLPAASACPPTATPPLQVLRDHLAQGSTCLGDPVASPLGAVALRTRTTTNDSYRFFGAGLVGGSTLAAGGELFGQPAGFTMIEQPPGGIWVFDFSLPLGGVRGGSLAGPRPARANLRAGGVVVAGHFLETLPAAQAVVRFESSGVRRWTRALPQDAAVFGVGEDGRGSLLVVLDGTALFGAQVVAGQWLSAEGELRGAPFPLLQGFTAGASTWFELDALADSALALRRLDAAASSGPGGVGPPPGAGGVRSQWAAVVRHEATQAEAPPGWLLDRPDTRLRLGWEGRAYALAPLGRHLDSCAQAVDVVQLDGTSCGSIALPIYTAPCESHDVVLGDDGSILQVMPPDRTPGECVVRHYRYAF